jgi:hypothetical protein
MKKTFVACLAVVALFAIASSASAIVCTIDQRPASTLLVPYFQVNVNTDGSIASGAASLDTIVTIGNASSAPMIAHVSIYNERSVLVLDFNVALTGFDVQAMSIASAISGNLPVTPVSKTHVIPDVNTLANDPCLRNSAARPATVGTSRTDSFMRMRNCAAQASCVNSADPNDPILATTLYPSPAWPAGGSFAALVLGQLTTGLDKSCTPAPNVFPLNGKPARGYIVIDHVNYCTISDPSVTAYYNLDAIGQENNLFGEVIFTSGNGVPTAGVAPVSIESSRVFSTTAAWAANIGGGGFANQTDAVRERTFYARYWTPSAITRPNANTVAFGTAEASCVAPCTAAFWDQGFGDEREPTGLKFAARYFEATSGAVISYFRVWRASAGTRTNLTGSNCTITEPTVNLTFYDEDENTIVPAGQPPCPSPCTIPPPSTQNFPLETQRVRVGAGNFTLPPAAGGVQVGWMAASFVNLGVAGNFGGLLDQAWIDYEFLGAGAFYNSSIPGTQLDPSTCHPLLIPLSDQGGTIVVPDALTDPITPGGHLGNLTNPATGTGP